MTTASPEGAHVETNVMTSRHRLARCLVQDAPWRHADAMSESDPSASQPASVIIKRPVTLHFTKATFRLVVILEIGFIAVGLMGSIFATFLANFDDVVFRGVLAALFLALAGSASYYLRKIYRAAFDGRFTFEGGAAQFPHIVATTLYLVGRPLISLPLSFASSLALILTYTTVAPSGVSPTENLVYVLGAAGFLTGFLGGRVIEQIENDRGL